MNPSVLKAVIFGFSLSVGIYTVGYILGNREARRVIPYLVSEQTREEREALIRVIHETKRSQELNKPDIVTTKPAVPVENTDYKEAYEEQVSSYLETEEDSYKEEKPMYDEEEDEYEEFDNPVGMEGLTYDEWAISTISKEEFDEGEPGQNKREYIYNEFRDEVRTKDGEIVEDFETLFGDHLYDFGTLGSAPNKVYIRNRPEYIDADITLEIDEKDDEDIRLVRE